MADILLTIGANIAEMVTGINEAGSRIKEFQSRVEEMGRSLLEIAGISLSAAGIAEFVEHFAKLGEEAERVQATLGINADQFVQLSGIAKLSGTDIESLSLGLERMTLNIQRSTRDGFNPLAQAMRMLGLNAQEFIKMNAADQFRTLAEHAVQFNASMNLTNALMLLGGRNVANLVSLLRSAGLNWDQWTAQIKASSVGLAEALPKMDETHTKLMIMETAAQSFGARLFNVLQPAINAAIIAITNFLNSLTTEKIAAFVDTAIADIEQFGVTVITWAGAAKTSWDDFINDLKATFGGPSITIDEDSIAGKAIGWLKSVVDQVRKWNEETKPALLGQVKDGAKELGEAFGPPAPTVVDKWVALIEQIRATIRDGLAKVKAEVSGGGKDFGAIPFGGERGASEARRLANIQFEIVKTELDSEVKTYQITEAQKTAILKAQAEERMKMEIKYGENAKVAEASKDLEIAKLNAEMTDKIVADWKKVADQFASDFSSALDQVLTKQKSFSAAMGVMFGKMIEQMLADLIKLIAEYAILRAVAGTALAPGVGAPDFRALATGAFPLLGGILGGGGQAAQTAALTANTGALAALTAAITGHAAVTATDTAATAAQTVATGGQTAATVGQTVAQSTTLAAWVANTVATAANTAATWAKAIIPGLETGAWNVGRVHGFPSYQGGIPAVPRTGLAVLHTGEMVIPAGPAQAVREGGGVGGQSVTLQISAIDANSFASWMRAGGGNQIVNYVSRAFQSNPSMRPQYNG